MSIKYNLHIEDQMFVVLVPFYPEGADEDGGSLIAHIQGKVSRVSYWLRTAVANEYKLDKEQTSYNDILEALRLSLQFYKRSKA